LAFCDEIHCRIGQGSLAKWATPVANRALCEVIAKPAYPLPPWTLAGDAFVAMRAVPAELARNFLPKELHPVQVVPGKTIAVVALIRYGAGSTLRYHELIVAPALVRHGFRVGAWISHICVDSEPSMHAGRDVWGLPKQLAAFSWQPDAAVARANDLHVSVEVAKSGVAARMPLLGPIFGSDAHQLKWSIARGSASLSRVPGALDVSGGDLDALGFDRVHTLYRLRDFHLTMGAPHFQVARAQACK
jgi:acetoacetate decarboxylase